MTITALLNNTLVQYLIFYDYEQYVSKTGPMKECKESTLTFLNEGNALSNETAEPVNITYNHLKRPSAARCNLHRTPRLQFPIWPPAWTKCANEQQRGKKVVSAYLEAL